MGKQITAQINKLLQNRIIVETQSNWNAGLIPILKPDHTLRLCLDFQSFNKVTVAEPYPLPLIDDILAKLSDGVYFSSLDALLGYYQIALHEGDTDKTAFT
jgi:hypothetical protein